MAPSRGDELTDARLAALDAAQIWNEDWLARQLWMAVFNTSSAHMGGPILSEEDWMPTWTTTLSHHEREAWKAAARFAQTLFHRALRAALDTYRNEAEKVKDWRRLCEQAVANQTEALTRMEAAEGEVATLRAALRALIEDLDMRAEIEAGLKGESEVVVNASAGVLLKARAALGGGD